jgi:hypothetical protein
MRNDPLLKVETPKGFPSFQRNMFPAIKENFIPPDFQVSVREIHLSLSTAEILPLTFKH